MNAHFPWTPGLWILTLSLGLGHALSGQSAAAALPESRPTIGFNQRHPADPVGSLFSVPWPGRCEAERQPEARRRSQCRSPATEIRRSSPGTASASELFQRISSTDPDEQMPPPSAGKPLTPAQIRLLADWIGQEHCWQAHWSFVPPRRPAAPPVKHRPWVRNPIDAFILARLEREGLAPAPEAERGILIRRVTLDLTGLPPTRAEIDRVRERCQPQRLRAGGRPAAELTRLR